MGFKGLEEYPSWIASFCPSDKTITLPVVFGLLAINLDGGQISKLAQAPKDKAQTSAKSDQENPTTRFCHKGIPGATTSSAPTITRTPHQAGLQPGLRQGALPWARFIRDFLLGIFLVRFIIKNVMEKTPEMEQRMAMGLANNSQKSPQGSGKIRQLHGRLRWSTCCFWLFCIGFGISIAVGQQEGRILRRDPTNVPSFGVSSGRSTGHEQPLGQEDDGRRGQVPVERRATTDQCEKKASEEDGLLEEPDSNSTTELQRLAKERQADAQGRRTKTHRKDQCLRTELEASREGTRRRRDTRQARRLRPGISQVNGGRRETTRYGETLRHDHQDKCSLRCFDDGKPRIGGETSCSTCSSTSHYVGNGASGAFTRPTAYTFGTTEHETFQAYWSECQNRSLHADISDASHPVGDSNTCDSRRNSTRGSTTCTCRECNQSRVRGDAGRIGGQSAGRFGMKEDDVRAVALITANSPSSATFQGSYEEQSFFAEYLSSASCTTTPISNASFGLDFNTGNFGGGSWHFFIDTNFVMNMGMLFSGPLFFICGVLCCGVITLLENQHLSIQRCKKICCRRHFRRPRHVKKDNFVIRRLFFLWLLCFPIDCLAQPEGSSAQPLNLDVFTQPIQGQAESYLYKELVIHSSDAPQKLLKANFELPTSRWRSWIGKQLGFSHPQRSFDDHHLYQVQPSPMDIDMIMATHFVWEKPGDRQITESMVLIDIKRGQGATQKTRGVWTLSASITRAELLHEVDLLRECQIYKTAECFVYIYGDAWLADDHTIRAILNGAYIRILVFEDEKVSSCSQSQDSSSSHVDEPPRRSRSRTPRSRTGSSDSQDSVSLMQTGQPQQLLQRAAEDQVFRLLQHRRARFGVDGLSGFGVLMWYPQDNHQLQRAATRVWLDQTQTSWTTQCRDVLGFPGLFVPQDLTFHLASPTPMRWQISPIINLLAVESNQETTTILLDWWIFTPPQRFSLRIQPDDTVASITRRIAPTLRHRPMRLTWHNTEGDIVFWDEHIVILPQGAYVHLTVADPEEREEDGCQGELVSMLQMQTPGKVDHEKRELALWPYGHSHLHDLHEVGQEGLAPQPTDDKFCTFLVQMPLEYVLYQHKIGFLFGQGKAGLSPFRSAMEGLRPPGNPSVLWRTHDFFKMDKIVKYTEHWEVVDDHHSSTATTTPAKNPLPKQIRLSELLQDEPQPCKSNHHKLDFMVDDDFFNLIFEFKEGDQLRQDVGLLHELHPATHEWAMKSKIIQFDTWDPNEAQEIIIFTDGSYQKKVEQAAWAFAVLARQNNESYFMGYMAAKVELSPQDAHFAGTRYAGASQSEVEALFWASLWINRFCISSDWKGHITFRWDATTAGAKAEGLASVNNSQHQGPTAHRMRCLQHLLQTLVDPLEVKHQHIYAHHGHPINELVDTAAKVALEESWSNHLSGPTVALIEETCPQAFDLMWLQYLGKDQKHQWPVFENGQLTWTTSTEPFFPSHGQKQSIKQAMLGETTTSPTREQVAYFDLYLASYNAMTFGDPGTATIHADRGRASLLRGQVQKQKITVIAFQEARTSSGTMHSTSHFRFASGRDCKGSGGIELWFSRENHFAVGQDQRGFFFKQQAFQVIEASPTILAIRYQTEEFDAVFIGAHAPHEGHPQHVKDQWWGNLSQLLDLPALPSCKFILCDANARIDQTVDDAFGGLSEDRENDNGSRLRAFALRHQLWAPSTFHSIHRGPLHTWEHPSAKTRARLDFILISTSVPTTQIWSCTTPEITTALGVPDHTCITLWMQWTAMAPMKGPQKKTFNRTRAMASENAHILAKIVQGIPQVSWEVDASLHAATITNWIHEQLVSEFPNNISPKTPKFASEAATLTYTKIVSARRELRTTNIIFEHKMKAFFFNAWRFNFYSFQHQQELKDFDIKISQLSYQVQKEAKILKNTLRKDRREFVHGITDQAKHLNVSEIYKALKPVMPNKKTASSFRPLPTVRKEDGTLTKNREEFDARWTEYFAALEGGHSIDFDDYLTEAFRQQAEQCLPQKWQPHEVPQLAWLERAVQQIRKGKMPGFDLIPGEIYKADPGKTAKALLPLLWKFVLRQQEAVSFKGGKLVALFKQKGAMTECTSYRSILLMSTTGKLMRAATRPLVNGPYARSSDELQLAGKKGSLVTFGSQAARSFLNIHKQKGWTASIVFGDVKSAFYQTLRQLSIGATCCDEDVAKIASFFSLDPSVMEELHLALNGQSAQQALGGSEVQNGLLQQSLSSTWFSTNANVLIQTHRGSRPGDSWADICFNTLFAAVVRSIAEELREEGFCLHLEEPMMLCPHKLTTKPTLMPLPHVTWADDIAILVSIKEAKLAARATAYATSAFLCALKRRAMEAAIGRGKTAALVLPRGPGSVEIRRQLFAKVDATLPVIMETETIQIPLVDHYRHLGGVIAARGGLLPELRTRAGCAKAAFWRLAKVLRSQNLDLTKRVTLFQATVLSIWTWGAGAWAWMSQKEYDFYVATTWRLYALMAPPKWNKDTVTRLSQQQLQFHLDLPHPECLLQEARLRNIGHMAKAAPKQVWILHIHDELARRASSSALSWFWAAMNTDSGLPHFEDWAPWLSLMQDRPQKWKTLVKTAARRHFQHQKSYFAVQTWHWKIYQEIQAVIPQPLRTSRPAVSRRELCVLCHQGFKNRRAWFLHAYGKHSFRSQHGRAAVGLTCHVCAKRYTSKTSLMHHFRYSPQCCTFSLLSHEGESEDGEQPRHSQLPWVHLASSGIDAQEVIDFEEEALLQHLHLIWSEKVQQMDWEDEPLDICQQIVDALTCVLPYPKLQAIFFKWIDQVCAAASETSLRRIRDLQRQVLTWFQAMLEEVGSDDSQEAIWWSTMVSEENRASFRPPMIHPKKWLYNPTEAFYLHFFSGRRREGDLQMMLEKCELPPNVTMYVISLDVTICSQRCDLRQPDQQLRWIRLIREQRVLGATSGPPCETWSRARMANSPKNDEVLPRPLRSQWEPWGKLAVSGREHLQLFIGNDLMLFSILCVFLVAYFDGFTVLEHPQSPSHYGDFRPHASIWQTAVLEWLMATNLFTLLMVNQGHYTAKSTKPTSLLIAGVQSATLVHLEKTLRVSSLPLKGSIGLEEGSNSWRTSSLKEYPPAFNGLIAQCFQVWLHQRHDRPSMKRSEDSTWLKDLCLKLSSQPSASSFGADFFKGGLQAEFKNLDARRWTCLGTVRESKVKKMGFKSKFYIVVLFWEVVFKPSTFVGLFAIFAPGDGIVFHCPEDGIGWRDPFYGSRPISLKKRENGF